MGKAVKWMILRNGHKENIIVSFEKRVNKEEILALINDYNKEEVHLQILTGWFYQKL